MAVSTLFAHDQWTIRVQNPPSCRAFALGRADGRLCNPIPRFIGHLGEGLPVVRLQSNSGYCSFSLLFTKLADV
jgi:hypothetical protein